jgi:glycopeptide antibiotics resistance protein
MLEIAQLVTPYRYTSFADVWRNALGCMVGCIVALAVHRVVRRSHEINRPGGQAG